MTWAAEATGPISPATLANSPTTSHFSALTLVSPKNGGTVDPAYAVSAYERAWYYYGTTNDGDQPQLLYRTSWEKDPWVPPTGRFAHPPLKFARPVHNTQLNTVWDTVGPLVDKLVHAAIKRSYSINTARFFTVPNGEDVKDGTLGSVVIWVFVSPGSTSADTAHEVSQDILQLLANNGVYGVDVEWSEGVTSKLVAPALLPTVSKRNATVLARRHLTTALSIPIAAAEKAENDGQGTGGFYFHENLDKNGDPSDKVLLVTNHHVLCKQDDREYDFRSKGSPRPRVRVCGSRRFQRGLDEIKDEVVDHGNDASDCTKEIGELEAKMAKKDVDEDDFKNLKKALQELGEHKSAIVELEQLYNEINANWGDTARRNIGFLEYSPPISVDVGSGRYTRDWATIRLDEARVKPNFKGNVIDLGTLPSREFKRLMHSRAGLLRIRGFLNKEQLANPESLDINGDPCLVVLKDGCVSDLTFGRCAGLESFLCDENGVRSAELAIYNYDKQSKPFSSKGDSGSLIVNRNGEMVGLLHSGKLRSAIGSSTYITYATPVWRLREWIKEVYPNADFTRETW
ncbi:hypothetical protein BDN72DRAFT_843693 [Pluteus cervinus]|uniref:Uncharacterized protein n=1 Tax=Pluteus cervinus TaxID=181527 RepID=A0ACD3AMK8_9AGAR|nr:hypothetical protein BDN72DRAFT_843693 [Pluteus cervinus]